MSPERGVGGPELRVGDTVLLAATDELDLGDPDYRPALTCVVDAILDPVPGDGPEDREYLGHLHEVDRERGNLGDGPHDGEVQFHLHQVIRIVSKVDPVEAGVEFYRAQHSQRARESYVRGLLLEVARLGDGSRVDPATQLKVTTWLPPIRGGIDLEATLTFYRSQPEHVRESVTTGLVDELRRTRLEVQRLTRELGESRTREAS